MAGRAGIVGVRLILSGSHAGRQTVKTIKEQPRSLPQLLGLLCQHLGFEKACQERGVAARDVLENGNLMVVGFDGLRRVPITKDEDMVGFMSSISQTTMPSIEAQLRVAGPGPMGSRPGTSASVGSPAAAPVPVPAPQVMSRELPAPNSPGAGQRGVMPRDQVEALEDENFKMLRSVDRVERQLDEILRKIEATKDHAELITNLVRVDLTKAQEDSTAELKGKIEELRTADAKLEGELGKIWKAHEDLEKRTKSERSEVHKKIKLLDEATTESFEDVGAEIQALKMKDKELEEEDNRQEKDLQAHEKELKRLNITKVDCELWQENIEETAKHVAEEFQTVHNRLTESEKARDKMVEQLQYEMKSADDAISRNLEDNVKRIDTNHQQLKGELATQIAKVMDALQIAHAELTSRIDGEVTTINDKMQREFKEVNRDINEKDQAIHKRVDEVSSRTELTFTKLEERIEEMVRVERARLGTIEREVFEGTAKIRSDFRSELERMRTDYEQDTSQMTEDLADLHMKYDVTKQEINFFQSRLVEQRDWQQRHLAETTTAMRAAQVDAQEGLTASQKMLHALRDDAVGFREKMAKYISLLQHSADSHGEAVGSLEAHRARMRLELDALITDHKTYTGDMDSWADDVRVKVERLFRANEPAKVEWVIYGATSKIKELKKPLAIKSPPFGLKGLREAQMELYPDGTNNCPEGKSVLRVFFPPGAQVRYQCTIAHVSSGSKEFQPGNGESLTTDVLFPMDTWRAGIREEDDALLVCLEVLRDHRNDDESLTREVRVESD